MVLPDGRAVGQPPSPCAPPPAHRGVDESEGDFPGGNLSPSWPMQDRTRQLAEMLLAGDMIRLAVGVEGWCGV